MRQQDNRMTSLGLLIVALAGAAPFVSAALDAIADMLRDPDWGVGMLEDIGDIVRASGRDIEGDGRPTWDRH